MWIIIWTIFVSEGYATLYSIILAVWGDENCYVQDLVWVKSLSNFVERSLQYVWWMYPLIWLLWPGGFKFTCCRKKKRRYVDSQLIESTVESNALTLSGSINEPSHNSASNESVDNICEYAYNVAGSKEKKTTYITPEEANLIQLRSQLSSSSRVAQTNAYGNNGTNLVMGRIHDSSPSAGTNGRPSGFLAEHSRNSANSFFKSVTTAHGSVKPHASDDPNVIGYNNARGTSGTQRDMFAEDNGLTSTDLLPTLANENKNCETPTSRLSDISGYSAQK